MSRKWTDEAIGLALDGMLSAQDAEALETDARSDSDLRAKLSSARALNGLLLAAHEPAIAPPSLARSVGAAVAGTRPRRAFDPLALVSRFAGPPRLRRGTAFAFAAMTAAVLLVGMIGWNPGVRNTVVNSADGVWQRLRSLFSVVVIPEEPTSGPYEHYWVPGMGILPLAPDSIVASGPATVDLGDFSVTIHGLLSDSLGTRVVFELDQYETLSWPANRSGFRIRIADQRGSDVLRPGNDRRRDAERKCEGHFFHRFEGRLACNPALPALRTSLRWVDLEIDGTLVWGVDELDDLGTAIVRVPLASVDRGELMRAHPLDEAIDADGVMLQAESAIRLSEDEVAVRISATSQGEVEMITPGAKSLTGRNNSPRDIQESWFSHFQYDRVRVPIMAIYGSGNAGITSGNSFRMDEELTEASKRHFMGAEFRPIKWPSSEMSSWAENDASFESRPRFPLTIVVSAQDDDVPTLLRLNGLRVYPRHPSMHHISEPISLAGETPALTQHPRWQEKNFSRENDLDSMLRGHPVRESSPMIVSIPDQTFPLDVRLPIDDAGLDGTTHVLFERGLITVGPDPRHSRFGFAWRFESDGPWELAGIEPDFVIDGSGAVTCGDSGSGTFLNLPDGSGYRLLDVLRRKMSAEIDATHIRLCADYPVLFNWVSRVFHIPAATDLEPLE